MSDELTPQLDTPLVSVIMGVYNAEGTVRQSVESILNQTYPDLEFIIINDGSTDGTADILSEIAAQDSRVNIITQENQGLTKSLNTGLRHAKGELIARQDSDDYALPARIAEQVQAFVDDQFLLLLGGNAIDEFEDGSQTEWGYTPDDKIKKRAMLCAPFPHASVMMRTETVRILGGYDEKMKTSQDMELWMRFAKHGKISMLEQPVMRRTIHKNAISSRRKFQQFRDGLYARRKHSPQRAPFMLYFSLRSLVLALLPARLGRALKSLRRGIYKS